MTLGSWIELCDFFSYSILFIFYIFIFGCDDLKPLHLFNVSPISLIFSENVTFSEISDYLYLETKKKHSNIIIYFLLGVK